MAKLVAPVDSGSVSVGGVSYMIRSGLVEVPEAAVHELVGSHGFTPIDDADDPDFVPGSDVETMKRVELFAVLKAAGVRVVPPITNDELRGLARKALTPVPPPAAVIQPTPVVPPVQAPPVVAATLATPQA